MQVICPFSIENARHKNVDNNSIENASYRHIFFIENAMQKNCR